jgi:hypothetical protein
MESIMFANLAVRRLAVAFIASGSMLLLYRGPASAVTPKCPTGQVLNAKKTGCVAAARPATVSRPAPRPAAVACPQGKPGMVGGNLNCPCNFQVPGSTLWWADCKKGLMCEGPGGYGSGTCQPYPTTSDIRLKQDIILVGRLANGIGLYRFRYKGDDTTVFVGVMAQEVQNILPGAVSRDRNGYLAVDYHRLGLDFMTWDDWVARNSAKSTTLQ